MKLLEMAALRRADLDIKTIFILSRLRSLIPQTPIHQTCHFPQRAQSIHDHTEPQSPACDTDFMITGDLS